MAKHKYPYEVNSDGSVSVYLPRNVRIVREGSDGRIRSSVSQYRDKEGKVIQQGYKGGSDYRPGR